jgi:hypothetical protein
VLPTWYLLGLALNLLRLPTLPSVQILLRYVGDVKLYGQQHRHDTWPLSDLGTPPRFMIRRRFARAMVDTALERYDRWYVLGHSLGSVVALNGLMEPGHTLPNYLDEERWRRCQSGGISRTLTGDGITDVTRMIPARPAWLDRGDSIERTRLFQMFRGLLTYGSPLDKFAVLFPATVPLNREQDVFPTSAEWINIHDATDPVAGALDLFGPFQHTGAHRHDCRPIAPVNYSVRCWPIAMWSHIKYFGSPDSNPVADAVQKWLITGDSFQSAFERAGAMNLLGRDHARLFSKWVQILAFFLATVALFTAVVLWLRPQFLEWGEKAMSALDRFGSWSGTALARCPNGSRWR